MRKFLIIPNVQNLEQCNFLAEKYNLGFEYNDFAQPDLLDNDEEKELLIQKYIQNSSVKFSTLHGAFFDVIPFSPDKKIREISKMRIEQSISAAKNLNAEAVIFHTNYNPFLNREEYVENWIKNNTEFWSEILLKNPKISIYLENMFEINPNILIKLSENLSKFKNFGICLDWAHASLSQVSPEIWAEKLSPFIKHIHINDTDFSADLHLAWGEGKINRNIFYNSCEKFFKNATILIETPFSKISPSLETLKNDGFI